jgi:polyhydroxyalkanoate synthesis regulator phasin
MPSGEGRNERPGLPEGLRAAVDRTVQATSGTAGRAQDLLDEVARRGQRTREDLAGIRFASARELRELRERLDLLEARLAAIEAKPNPTVED